MEEEMQTTQTAEAPLAVKIISLFGIIVGLIGIILFGLGLVTAKGGFLPSILVILVISIILIWSSFGIRKMKTKTMWVFMISTLLTIVGLIGPSIKFIAAASTRSLYPFEGVIGIVTILIVIEFIINFFYLLSVRKRFS